MERGERGRQLLRPNGEDEILEYGVGVGGEDLGQRDVGDSTRSHGHRSEPRIGGDDGRAGTLGGETGGTLKIVQIVDLRQQHGVRVAQFSATSVPAD